MISINERIQQIIKEKFKDNKAAFSRRIEIKPTTLANLIREEKPATPSSDILERIIRKIPEINPGWLLTGRGNMLVEHQDQNYLDLTGNVVYDYLTNSAMKIANGIESIALENKEIIETNKKLSESNAKLIDTNQKLVERILELTEKGAEKDTSSTAEAV